MPRPGSICLIQRRCRPAYGARQDVLRLIGLINQTNRAAEFFGSVHRSVRRWLFAKKDGDMVPPAVPGDPPPSLAGKDALQDMVELEMYLVAQSQQSPWSLLARRSKIPDETRLPYSTSVEASAVKELMDRRFIEATSSRTFVVSKSGYQFYERSIKPRISMSDQGGAA